MINAHLHTNQDINLNDWTDEDLITTEIMPATQLRLLTHRGSLSAYLREVTAQKIAYQFLHADWSAAKTDECPLLHIKASEKVWLREIHWHYQGEMWVHGSTIIPSNTLPVTKEGLDTLGGQSIGDILFQDKNLVRSNFQIRILTSDHPDFINACQTLAEKPALLWARRSVFYFHKQPLLVNEVFFPDIFEFMKTQA